MWGSSISVLVLLWACLVCQAPAAVVSLKDAPHSVFLPRATATAADNIDAARKVVKDAIAKMAKLNKARLDKPLRNRYHRHAVGERDDDAFEASPPPLLDITEETARVAALVAEADVDADVRVNSHSGSSSYWFH